MLSKIDNNEFSVSSSTPGTLLAWSSKHDNKISVIDLESVENHVTFDGASVSDTYSSWTQVKEIPNSKLLVSLHQNIEKFANIEIFDISKKRKANKIYSLGEISGRVGDGDMTYNSRRRILGAISVRTRIAYHLFNLNACASGAKEIVKLIRKSKWHSQYSTQKDNCVASFDFNPAGESIATIDKYGVCLISDVGTNDYGLHLQVGSKADMYGRCRWSTNTEEPLLFVKYDDNKLNILNVEKKALILRNPVTLDARINHMRGWTIWIDVCQSNGNLLVLGGNDQAIRIFDKRESKIVKTFKGVHSNWINCVRWNPSGDMIASASVDKTAKLFDLRTEKVLYTATTSDGNYAMSVCFI